MTLRNVGPGGYLRQNIGLTRMPRSTGGCELAVDSTEWGIGLVLCARDDLELL